MLKYEKSNIPLAKKLRKNMTDCERKLWYEFLRSYPLRFQRQKVIGKYIADFYCAKAGLVVELDGGEHYEPEQIEYDAERTKYLNEVNIQVLRFTNIEVLNNFYSVCSTIDEYTKSRLPLTRELSRSD